MESTTSLPELTSSITSSPGLPYSRRSKSSAVTRRIRTTSADSSCSTTPSTPIPSPVRSPRSIRGKPRSSAISRLSPTDADSSPRPAASASRPSWSSTRSSFAICPRPRSSPAYAATCSVPTCASTATGGVKKPEDPKLFPWHQDNGYNFVEPQTYLTCWIALTDATVENGCPWVQPGGHLRGTLKHHLTELGWVCRQDDDGALAAPVRAGACSCSRR